MASYLISDSPYAAWISDVLATLDAICANGKSIQQAWEDAAEDDEED